MRLPQPHQGGSPMPRGKTAATATVEATDTPPAGQSAGTPAEPPQEPAADAKATPAHTADPHPVTSVSLSEYRRGPSMHLLWSKKFLQMQIRFDGEQPSEQHLARLKQAGWTDRTEGEGV